MSIEVNGKTLETDEEGYLSDIQEWDTAVAEAMAGNDGIALTDEHWGVINILRDYYNEYQSAPAIRVLNKTIGKQMGKEKGNSDYVYSLFPEGPAVQACRHAEADRLRLDGTLVRPAAGAGRVEVQLADGLIRG